MKQGLNEFTKENAKNKTVLLSMNMANKNLSQIKSKYGESHPCSQTYFMPQFDRLRRFLRYTQVDLHVLDQLYCRSGQVRWY